MILFIEMVLAGQMRLMNKLKKSHSHISHMLTRSATTHHMYPYDYLTYVYIRSPDKRKYYDRYVMMRRARYIVYG